MSADQPLLQTVSNTASDLVSLSSSFDYQEITTSQWQEMWIILKLSVPIFLSVFCEWFCELVAFIIIGHSIDSSTNLAIVALAYAFYNFVLFIVWGLLSGLYTLIQETYKRRYEHNISSLSVSAHGGYCSSNDPATSSIDNSNDDESQYSLHAIEYYIQLYAQRSFLITLLVSIPFVILLSYGGTLLVFMGVDASLEMNVNFVCTELIATLYMELWRSILQRIIESIPDKANVHNINRSLFVCNLCTALLSLPCSWFFILFLDLGFKGFAIVITVCNLLNLALIVALLCCVGYAYIFRPLPLHKIVNYKGVKQYLQLSIPGMVISLLEMSTAYLIVILSAFVHDAQMAICCAIIMITLMRFLQFVFTGISYALSIRIDGYIYMECLGKYRDGEMMNKAKQTRNCAYLIVLLLDMVICTLLYFLKEEVLFVFINDQAIMDLCGVLVDILIIHSFLMSFEYLLSAILRSIGEPFGSWPAHVILCAYYIVPFPAMLVLLFYFDYDLQADQALIVLFSLFALSKFISVITMQLIVCCRVDWKKIIAQRSYKNLSGAHCKNANKLQLQTVDI